MNSTTYVLPYLIINVFYVYTIFRFMGVFFEREDIKKNEVISYFIFYIVITFVFLFFNIPLLTLFTNVVFFFILSLNYKGNLKKKIISVVFMNAILAFSEIIIYAFLVKSSGSMINSEYVSIPVVIFSRIMTYLAVLIFEGFKNVKNEIELPNTYWFSVIFIPLGSMYLTIILFENSNLDKYELLISISILFIINIVTFYLYDILNKRYREKLEKELLENQNNYYEEQFKIMNSSYKKIRSIKHDLKNHLIVIGNYIDSDKGEKALDYINKINDFSVSKREVSYSGNIDIDSILNYKIHYAKSIGINVDLNIKIPYDLDLDSFDMNIIIGNLLDNAIEANKKLDKEKRYISINIVYSKNIIHMHFKNSFDGNIIKEQKEILTTKKNKLNHGIGFKNIKYILKKYDGALDCTYDNNIFSVRLLIYL